MGSRCWSAEGRLRRAMLGPPTVTPTAITQNGAECGSSSDGSQKKGPQFADPFGL